MIETVTLRKNKKLNLLTSKGVIHLHDLLSKNYTLLQDMDPVEPKGVKNMNLLESAVGRQYVGVSNWLKYDKYCTNCATLIYGIIKNHAFHNGNKRTGFLSLIKHLYINGYVLQPSIKSEEIYKFIVCIADNKLLEFINKYKQYKSFVKREKLQKVKVLTVEQEISFISYWIRSNSISKNCEIKNKVKISKLKELLVVKGIKIEQSGVKIKVYSERESNFLGIKIGIKKVNEREYTIGNSITEVSNNTLKKLRKDFNLRISDGVDNLSFYDDESFLDEEIKNYKKIIYRLSKT